MLIWILKVLVSCNTHVIVGWQGAISLYEERMPSAGIAPDIVTFNALIRSVGRSRRADLGEKATSWFSTLCQLGLRPDKYTFSAFFNTAYHCKLTDGAFLLHVSI